LRPVRPGAWELNRTPPGLCPKRFEELCCANGQAYLGTRKGLDAALYLVSRSSSLQLHLVPAQVLVVQPLEPAAELLSRRAFRRAGGIQFGRLHHLLGDVDRAIGAQRQRNRI
jgi:hypothetical protein